MLAFLYKAVHLVSPVVEYVRVQLALILVNKSQLRQQDQKLIQKGHKNL